MSKFIIDYDLKAPGRDYDSLIEAIKSYGLWAKICESTWAIKSSSSASVIRDNLMKHIDANDRLFVSTLGDDWAAYGIADKVADWLNK